jgi:hypothetical protein
MSRIVNLIVFIILSSSIYVTFSIKNQVGSLAKQVVAIKNDIRQEQDKIDIYKAQYALSTGASHIDTLRKRHMPYLKVVSVEQIKLITDYVNAPQFAQNYSTIVATKYNQKN